MMVLPKPQELVVDQADGLLTADDFDRSTDRVCIPVEVVYKANTPHLALHINHLIPSWRCPIAVISLLAYPHYLDCRDHHIVRIQHSLQTLAITTR